MHCSVLLFLAGSAHTVCVMEDGTAVSFGYGLHGQLGHGDTVNQLYPKAIAGLAGVGACSAGEALGWCMHLLS